MQNRICATVTVYSATLIGLLGCGGSSADEAAVATGGAVGIGGGNATGGVPNTGGGKATGGGTSSAATGGAVAVTGGSKAVGGSLATGGSPSTGGSTSATGGVATGGVVSAGGSTATGGTKATATGGSTATSDAGVVEAEAMCNDVCALLANRNPPLTCVPSDCVGTCNRTFSQLNGAKTACSDAYVALYECGLSQPANAWECFSVTAGTFEIDIPVPPRSAETCGTEYTTLYSTILMNLTTCGAALSW